MQEPDLQVDVHDGRGSYLLLVHGFLSSRAQWLPNLAALSSICRPVVVELWGHGRSPTPEDQRAYTGEGYVDAFERIRERLGCESWLLCGQSLGAALTLRYALDCPARVRAHILTNSSSAFATNEMSERMRSHAERQAVAIARSTPEELERIPVHPANARRFPQNVHEALVADAKLHDPIGLARTLQYTTPAVSSRHRVGENRTPTLLVYGERESRFQPHRAFAEANLPKLEAVPAPAGHAVNIEAADAFNAAVLAFLGGHL